MQRAMWGLIAAVLIAVLDGGAAKAQDLKLLPGWSATVFAPGVGSARHLAVAPNGDVYVRLRTAKGGGGVVALRDEYGTGVANREERFDKTGGTGITIWNGYLYISSDTAVYRYRLTEGKLVPEGEPETIVSGFPAQRVHASKPLVIDTAGNLFVTIGAPSNACQLSDRQTRVKGQQPCVQLAAAAGVWRFKADQPGQTFEKDGVRFATGIRNALALAWSRMAGGVFSVVHGRDQLNTLWPEYYSAQDNAEVPAEELIRLRDGGDYGWPYSYFDGRRKERMIAPEYGGDGRTAVKPGRYDGPLAAYPAHWAPNAIAFYETLSGPLSYRGGLLIAFHGSWNRAPLPQAGYKVLYQAMKAGLPDGAPQVFADGFAGKPIVRNPAEAVARPTGIAVSNDGAVYIADSQKGKIWKLTYQAEN
ncbi:PQQ-dependent sugar dehydrogenase [Govanella unica]|uniref:PQQ-dependent sugar dehydrogenase n=1 Tax=Govanella unica TaxID=2975056 RepID=A0A9X3Z858_9PROT|nr:PQQ-dependent sugar dehydrogenase [Govania unica]MDA5194748.1 PQQ-dependent sugar dehydrogenase [Govania unica]